MDINSVILNGRLTKDPEYSVANSGTPICKFSIAVNGYKENDVSFFNVVCFKGLAENVNKYCHKGSQVSISGELKQDRWQDKEGKNRSTINIIANKVQFIGGKPQSNTNSNTQSTEPNYNMPPAGMFGDAKEVTYTPEPF